MLIYLGSGSCWGLQTYFTFLFFENVTVASHHIATMRRVVLMLMQQAASHYGSREVLRPPRAAIRPKRHNGPYLFSDALSLGLCPAYKV